MKATLGIITIGQAPRTDVTGDIKEITGNSITIREIGLLDDYSYDEAEKRYGPSNHEPILVSRMRDGRGIRLSDEKIQIRMQEVVSREEKKLDIILILCTAPFPNIVSSVPVLVPQPIIQGLVGSLSAGSPVGVIVPEEEQKKEALSRWAQAGVKAVPIALSPYQQEKGHWQTALRPLAKKSDIHYIIMDCMGYSKEMRQIVQEVTRKNIILPRTMIMRIIVDLICP
jgi:protein AroM